MKLHDTTRSFKVYFKVNTNYNFYKKNVINNKQLCYLLTTLTKCDANTMPISNKNSKLNSILDQK